MSLTKNPNVLKWVDEMVALCQPDKVVWIDGSKEQIDALIEEVTSLPDDSWDKMYKLNQEKYPNCLYHRTRANDVARVEDRTFICSKEKKGAGPTNNWMAPDEMKALLTPMYNGVMKGRTMYVIPYSMGPIGSPLAKVGVEVTDSIYVVLNMNIMTRMGKQAFENLGDTSDDFVRGLHSKADVDPEKRYIVQFPEENTIWSINSAYGGNVLLGKKCFALRIASFQGKNEAWMAEHMLILGVKKPNGDVKYITAAFPSACGKTNLAMLIPPEGYKKDGYEVFTVGDDIAWMKPGKDGRLYAINPENGFFGVAPGTNAKSNYNALACTKNGAIFTNVALDNSDNTPWWEKLTENPPKDATEWKGEKVDGEAYTAAGNKLAHPNSRFTAPAKNCPCISPEFNNPEGVPISAIGIQSHQHQGYWGLEKLHEVLTRFEHFGIPIHFTENTLISGDIMPAYIEDLNDWQVDEWPSTPDGLERQAREVSEMYTELFAHPLVEAITTWDLTDGKWLKAPSGVLTVDNKEKPVYDALMGLIHGEWETKENFVTDENGYVTITGFKGEYEVSANGKTAKVSLLESSDDIVDVTM